MGESHTDIEFHDVQLRVIQELHKRGRQVLVGLEMYPVPEQQWLDRWHSDKTLTEEGFLAESHWYKNWGYHWNYYRDIFLFARANGIRMFGVNLPRAAVQTIRMKGFDALSPEQKALLPEKVDVENAEHQRLFRAFFGSEDALHGNMPEPMFQAHVPRAVRVGRGDGLERGAGAQEARRGEGDHGRAHRLGPRRLRARRRAPGEAVVRREDRLGHPRPDRGGAGTRRPSRRCRRPTPTSSGACPPRPTRSTRASGSRRPEAKSGERYKIIMVGKDSPAAVAGFKVGDELVSIDGTPYTDKEIVNRLMSEKRWGDAVVYKVMRDGQELTLTAHLRRPPPKAKAAPAAGGGQ